VTWSCGHEGSIGVEWLQRHCYSAHSLWAAMEKRRPSTAVRLEYMAETFFGYRVHS